MTSAPEGPERPVHEVRDCSTHQEVEGKRVFSGPSSQKGLGDALIVELETDAHIPTESRVGRPIPTLKGRNEGGATSEMPCPVPRTSQRSNAGVHGHPNRLPRSACS